MPPNNKPRSVPNEPEFLLPFNYMRVGQSFFVPTTNPEVMLAVIQDCIRTHYTGNFRPAIYRYNGMNGVRVWRVA